MLPIVIKRGDLFKFKTNAFKYNIVYRMQDSGSSVRFIPGLELNNHVVEILSDTFIYNETDAVLVYIPALQVDMQVYFYRLEQL